jgi:hypothetical protein
MHEFGYGPELHVDGPDRAQHQGLAHLPVAEVNAALELSEVDTHSQVVQTYRTPDYAEPTDELAQRTILRDLTRVSDLAMSEVHVKRE